jgi:hypothetical protein
MADTRDIVERLENEAKIFEQTLLDDTVDLIREAAAEITRLRDEQKEVVIPGPSCDDDWLPDYARGHGRGFNDCRRKFIAALTKAGVAVKEVGRE